MIAPLISKNKTLHHFEEFRFALFPRRGGRALELDNVEQLAWMGRFIGRLHAVGACRDFQHRPILDIQTHGVLPYQFLLENNFIPNYLKDQYCRTMDIVLKKIETAFFAAGKIKLIRLHGDCHIGNVLWNDLGPHIVDLDDSVMGPAIQDIWMLLSGDQSQHMSQLHIILEGYREFFDFNFSELHLPEAMRTLRMIQYSAWLAGIRFFVFGRILRFL